MPLSWMANRAHSLNVFVCAHMHTQLTYAHVCTPMIWLFWKDAGKWDTSQTLELPHLWQFFCPQPELHPTPGREGTTQLLEIGSYCCVLLHSPRSACHWDSILGSHLVGMVSKTCSRAREGVIKKDQKSTPGHQQSELHLFSPACTCPQFDATGGFPTATESTGWDSHDEMPSTIQSSGLQPRGGDLQRDLSVHGSSGQEKVLCKVGGTVRAI